MSNKHSKASFRAFGAFVNMSVVLITVSLIGAGYINAVASFSGMI